MPALQALVAHPFEGVDEDFLLLLRMKRPRLRISGSSASVGGLPTRAGKTTVESTPQRRRTHSRVYSEIVITRS